MEFEKLSSYNSGHLKALNVLVKINGRSVFKVLVNRGSTLNLVPCKFFKKLKKKDVYIQMSSC